MRANPPRKRHIVPLSMALFAGLMLTQLTSAQSRIAASEDTLVFRGLVNEPLKRSFSLEISGEPIDRLSILRHDLVDAESGAVILSGSLAIEPEEVEHASGLVTFEVTIPGVTRPGHYLGELEIFTSKKFGPSPLEITLDVLVEAVPSVDADVNAKSLTLWVTQPFGELPYLQRPVGDSRRTSAEVVVYLVQNGEGEAEVQSAKVLTMRGQGGRTLPEEAVRVATEFPVILSGNDAEPLRIIAGGRHLPAGEYTGTLLVRVRNQTSAVQIPLTVKVKHGPLLPLIVLLVGVLTSGVFAWWSGTGKTTRDLAGSIQTLAKDIRTEGKLQATERDEAFKLVEAAMDAVNEGRPAGEIQTRFDAAQTYISERRDAAVAFIEDRLKPQIEKARGLAPGRTYRDNLLDQLQTIERRTLAGEYNSLDEAINALGNENQGLVASVAALEEAVREFASLPEEQNGEVRGKIDAATTYQEMRRILKDAGVEIPARPGVAYDVRREGKLGEAASDRISMSLRRKLQLSTGSLLVGLVVYLFAVAVGWVTLYVSKETFGADPAQYLTLFLWGASVEAVRGQTLNLEAVYEKVKQINPT